MQEFIKMISENMRLEQFGWALDLILAAILGFFIGLERKFTEPADNAKENKAEQSKNHFFTTRLLIIRLQHVSDILYHIKSSLSKCRAVFLPGQYRKSLIMINWCHSI